MDPEEEQRRRKNLEAWRNWRGYETTSGCPLWDRTPHLCIPKSGWGWGLNINFWYLFCCCICQDAVSEDVEEE